MPNITYNDDPNGGGVPSDNDSSQFLAAGDTLPVGITLLDADGNTLNPGDSVPAGQAIHYVLNDAGTSVLRQRAFTTSSGCCFTKDLVAPDGTRVTLVAEMSGGVVTSTAYLLADLTAYGGDTSLLAAPASSSERMSWTQEFYNQVGVTPAPQPALRDGTITLAGISADTAPVGGSNTYSVRVDGATQFNVALDDGELTSAVTSSAVGVTSGNRIDVIPFASTATTDATGITVSISVEYS